jgi:hypothetical protein
MLNFLDCGLMAVRGSSYRELNDCKNLNIIIYASTSKWGSTGA